MSNINITNQSNLNISQEEIKNNQLKEEIMKLKMENSKLRKKVLHLKFLEVELNKANEHIHLLNKEKYELMMKQNEEIKNYKLEMEKILNEKDFHLLNYNKRLSIFEQKIGKVNELEMENKVYKEELNDLKEKNKILEESTSIKSKELEVKNQLKFKKIKNAIMNNLTETKENMLKLNLKHMDINTKIIYLQNNKLLEDIDNQNKKVKQLIDEKNKLKIKILDLENKNDIGNKIQLELTHKLNNTKNEKDNSYKNINLFNKKNKKKNKKYFSFKKNFLINNGKEKFLDSNIFNVKEKKNYQNNKSEENKNSLKNIEPYVSKKNFNNNKCKTINNTFSKTEYNSLNIKSNSLMENTSRLKYKQIINEKNYEIDNLNLKIESLNNRISFFTNKYKKLYNFLEECLNSFFWELKDENNYNINYEELIQFNFSKLKKKEQYAVLVLLMNHLLPLITFNFNSNCNLGNNIFTTNINIFDKTFNKTYKHLNDNILKKSFVQKNNKLQTDLFIKNDTLLNGAIPVLRKRNKYMIINDKLKEDKYKFIL